MATKRNAGAEKPATSESSTAGAQRQTTQSNDSSSSGAPDGVAVKVGPMWFDPSALEEDDARVLMASNAYLSMGTLTENGAVARPIIAATLADVWVAKPKQGEPGWYKGVVMIDEHYQTIVGIGKALPDAMTRFLGNATQMSVRFSAVAVMSRQVSASGNEYNALVIRWVPRKQAGQLGGREAEPKALPGNVNGATDQGNDDDPPF